MSELTPCNYCSLRNIRRRAERKGLNVTLRHEGSGTTVYIHPSDVTEFPLREDGEPDEYFAAWFMALTDHCVC
jgi:hypothetical protein